MGSRNGAEPTTGFPVGLQKSCGPVNIRGPVPHGPPLAGPIAAWAMRLAIVRLAPNGRGPSSSGTAGCHIPNIETPLPTAIDDS
jgi:hypothetical protein